MGAAKRKKGRARGAKAQSPQATSSSTAESQRSAAPAVEERSAPGAQSERAGRTSSGCRPAKVAERPASTNAFAQGGDPAVKPRGAALWGLNLFIGGLLFLFTVDALPNSIPGLGRLNGAIDPVVDKLGLAQGEWKLFSPDPDHINAYVEAVITYSDGSTRRWTTPEWRDRSLLEKFFQGRHPKFSDAFRMDRNKFIWPYLADYILTQVEAPQGAKPTQVELLRHWWEVPLPKDMPAEMKKYEHMPPHREEYSHEYSFYTKKL